MAALMDMPRTFLSDFWDQAKASNLLSSLRGMAANATVESSAKVATEVPARLASSGPVMKGFFDPSSVYTSGYALGVAIMVRLLFSLAAFEPVSC